MAKDIQPIERTTLTPTQSVSAGTAFERMGTATLNLSQMISSKLNDVQVQMEAEKGAQDALSGEAPKTLAPGFNRVTRAYNTAVSDTEARHLVSTAKQQINEAYLKATDPSNFTNETPAVFKSTLQGIVQGTLENTRDSNRPQVQLALNQLSADASVEMLRHSIDYDNKQTIKNMTNEVDDLVKERRNAAIEGNEANVQAVDEKINEALTSYSVQNAAIRASMPQIVKKLEQNKKIDQVLGDFAQAAHEGKQAEYLTALAENRDKLDFDTWDQATKTVLALDVTEQKLKYQTEAITKQSVLNQIDNGTITTASEITSNPNLKPLDQLQLIHELEKNQRALAKAQYKTLEAQKNIAQGRPGFNSSEIKNQMFTAARNNFESLNNRPMSLAEMWDSINGDGPTPASGMPGVSMGANVPQFDDQLKNQLTSNDPAQVAAAAMIYNQAVNVSRTPNMINLSGDALAIATHFNTLNLGNVDPLTLAQRVSNVTLKATDADYAQRSKNFNKLYSNDANGIQRLRNQYTAVFGTAYKPGVDDNAMGVFTETFRQQYLKSTNEDAALAATRQEMRSWGTSKYFEAGMVAQPVPEKELGIAQIGYALDNQLRVRTQLLIDEQKRVREENAKLPKNKQAVLPFNIEWVSPEQNINLATLTDTDRVFKPLGQSTGLTSYFQSQSKPKVKINGQETEVFLMPTPESKLGDRIQYALFYHDKFGMVQPIPDPNSPNGMAMFAPDSLDQWAPSVQQSTEASKVKEAALKFQREEAKQDWDALSPGGVIGRLIKESTYGMFQSDSPEVASQKADIVRRYFSEEPAALERIFKERIRGENAATQPAKSLEADHVGISADQNLNSNPTKRNK